MCGIIGYVGVLDAGSKVAAGLKVIRNRGLDGFGIASRGGVVHGRDIQSLEIPKTDTAIGHCLHSIVGSVMQPLKQNGVLVANCEIYNWKELNEKYSLDAKNDSEVIIKLIEKKGVENIIEVLDELDGVYAFAYWVDDVVYLARDIVGVKPLWYDLTEGLTFCSETKAIQKGDELNPRRVLKYNVKTEEVKYIQREFFTLTPELKKSLNEIQEELKGLIINAISKRVPDQKFGILFSGGIDSTLIALVCQQLGVDFTCYTAALEEEGLAEAEDLVWAEKVAKELGFELKVKKLNLKESAEYLKTLVPLIEDSNVVKVGVGLTFYVACELARKDGVRVIFSGLGSEELFAGYERHKKSLKVNEECLSGILKIYERDNYRDDVITMNNNIELRIPFMDKTLVNYALKIPAEYKLDDTRCKIILRQVAEQLGLPPEFAERKKRAAQYGSRFDKALDKLAKRNGFDLKSEYLKQFYNPKNLKLGALFSSGKDSTYAMYIMDKQNYDIACLISIKSQNPDSWMFHTPNIGLVNLQAEAMGIPLIEQSTEGKKEDEIQDMVTALEKAKKQYQIEGVITGALYSNYQRERIEKACDKLGLKIFSPLWHIDQELEMRSLVKNRFNIVFSSVAADGLDKSWLGRTITDEDIDALVGLNKKIGLHVAGEGGEFESLVLDCPLFTKKIEIVESEINEENEYTAKLLIKKAVLKNK